MKHDPVKSSVLAKQKALKIALGASKVFKRKGYQRSTVREIAAASNLTAGNLYDYMDTKEDILFLVFKEFHDLWVKSFSDKRVDQISDIRQQLNVAFKTMSEMTNQMHEMAFLMYTESKSLRKKHLSSILSQESKLINQFENILRKGIEQGVFECENPDLIASLIVYLLNFSTLRFWSVKEKYSPEEITDRLIEFIMSAISKR